MVLRALWCWLRPKSQGYVRVVGDAQGVLAAFLKRSAKSFKCSSQRDQFSVGQEFSGTRNLAYMDRTQ